MSSISKIKYAVVAAVVLSGASVNASAAWEELAGAGVGAAIGSRMGGGNGKVLTTVVGGVSGYRVGEIINERNVLKNGQPSHVPASGNSAKKTLGTIGGGIAGAVIGNRFGKGNGKKVMTVVGAVGGALLGRSLFGGDDRLVMRDIRGREWVNGTEPLDPVTEAPTFDREVRSTQDAYINYANAIVRYSHAKNDYDWKRIDRSEYSKHQREASIAAREFSQARSSLWDIASTAATTYNKKIEEEDMLIIASCNAVPTNINSLDVDLMMQNGAECGYQSPKMR